MSSFAFSASCQPIVTCFVQCIGRSCRFQQLPEPGVPEAMSRLTKGYSTGHSGQIPSPLQSGAAAARACWRAHQLLSSPASQTGQSPLSAPLRAPQACTTDACCGMQQSNHAGWCFNASSDSRHAYADTLAQPSVGCSTPDDKGLDLFFMSWVPVRLCLCSCWPGWPTIAGHTSPPPHISSRAATFAVSCACSCAAWKWMFKSETSVFPRSVII